MNIILKSIFPSLAPFLRLSTPDFLFTAPRHSPEILSFQSFIDLLSRVRAVNQRYTGGGPAPVPPRNLDLIMTPVTSMQKPGLDFLLPTIPDKHRGHEHK